MNSTKISKFGLQSTLIIVVLMFIGRFLFPFGDEPDWYVRAPHILFGEHPINSGDAIRSDDKPDVLLQNSPTNILL